MTDEHFVYTQDIRERKGMASGARGVKRGSRSKQCSLPSDNLTAAQRKKLNGELVELRLNEPMSWSTLKTFSPHLQFQYLDHLINHYHARRVDLLSMLGVSTATFFNHQKTLPGKLIYGAKRRKPAPEWEAFLASSSEPTVVDSEPLADDAPTQAVQRRQSSLMVSGSVTVRGSLGDATAALVRLLDDMSAQYTFTFSFQKEDVSHDQAT